MFYYLYQITNSINGKIYIGFHKTKDFSDNYMGSGKVLLRAYDKYGMDNFIKEILQFFNTEEEMIQAEIDIVDTTFIRRRDTYNIKEGGCGGFSYIDNNGLKYSVFRDDKERCMEYSRKGIEILERLRQNPEFTKPYYRKISEGLFRHYESNVGYFLGRKHTDLTKERIGKANSIHQKGIRNSQYGTMWITDNEKNRKIKKSDPIPEGWCRGRIIIT